MSWEELAGWNVEVTKGVTGKVERRGGERAPSEELSLPSKHSGLLRLCGHRSFDGWNRTPPGQGDLGPGAGCPGRHSFSREDLELVPFLAVSPFDGGSCYQQEVVQGRECSQAGDGRGCGRSAVGRRSPSREAKGSSAFLAYSQKHPSDE